ncbi:centriolar coiled-coil protein of 110 kda [Plakobranchus ocellatus]|uniref:Centriolar coiled-coil protein of 110 kDa n=1 Tax=Plakobranchus ocellatus TaxID=259542 RepID=A0AAV4D2Q4_9GAST|nr:centriolar coiled-coil protein of 110 kda [Plakobranchus ocellatus]
MGEAAPCREERAPSPQLVAGPARGVSAHQLSLGVSITVLRVMCGSPGGMGQLIKYFESQSKRLDKQAPVPQASFLNSDFESLIKFNGIPILPPAMTSSRREELQQLKKKAVLFEKRLKARQRRQLMSNADSFTPGSQLTFPETSPRPTARQLNFDCASAKTDDLPDRFGATNPVSTFATAETALGVEDFGLQTMDSVNSDFMSMEQSSIPRVFAGLDLTTYKEQKISYDLDKLSKVLNVEDMTSTSGSDLSDALGNTQNLGDENLQDAQRLAQKFLHNTSDGRGGQTTGFFHESQDTVVEVSPEPGAPDGSSTSGFVDNTNSSNLEHTQTSLGSSPGCGSANTTGTTDSQRSNRSSPKSLKNAVHFASFLTEYNTTTSQLFERPTIVKKKMPYEQSVDHTMLNLSPDGVTPIIGDPSEARQRNVQKSSADGASRSVPLLNRVSLNPESDSSPVTPPFDPVSGMPFQSYGKPEPYSSDKENDASHSQAHKKSPDRPGRAAPSPKDQTIPEVSHRRVSHRRNLDEDSPNSGSSDAVGKGNKNELINSKERSHTPSVGLLRDVSGSLDKTGSSHAFSTSKKDLISSTVVLSTGVVTMGQTNVSDSQSSNKSATLTGGTSESSSSTIKDDLSARDSGNLGMNIVVAGHGSINMDTAQEEKNVSGSSPPIGDNNCDSISGGEAQGKCGSETTHSPKKLNTEHIPAPPVYDNDADTPPRQFVRKGSYTLSEPSPALLKAREKYQEVNITKNEAEPQKGKSEDTDSPVSNIHSNKVEEAAETQHAQRKLPTVTQVVSKTQPEINTSRLSASPEAEREGKAEHINKYLSQVQFQSSMNLSCQSWDAADQIAVTNVSSKVQDMERNKEDQRQDSFSHALEPRENEENLTSHSSVLDVLRSLAESVQGSREQASVTELLSLHQDQMEQERQALIQQQQKDMEELFVQQRRDMMLLEAEIKAAQQLEKEQQEFIIQNLPENIKVKARNQEGEFSPQHTGTFQQSADIEDTRQTGIRNVVPESINSLDNRRPQSHYHRQGSGNPNSGGEFSLQLQPKSFPGAAPAKHVQVGKKTSQYPLMKKGKVSPYSPRSAWEESQTHVKTVANDSFSPRENAVRSMPGFSMGASSPRIHRPLMQRSPFKSSGLHHHDVKIHVPPEANTPEMQAKFDKVTAVAKGFLIRCLLRSDKVQELIKTIKDTREFAFKVQTETPVKKGVFTPQDRALLERIVAQLQAALLDIHEIFFEISSAERMALIEQTRNKEHDKRVKMSRDSLRGSGPRISQATLKALERKRKAKEAEASVVLSTARPRTAPASTSSPRCQNHTDIRALKPLQGQAHHKSEVSAGVKQDSSGRSDKARPGTAPAKQLTKPKRITALASKQTNTQSTSSELNKDFSKESLNKPNSIAATKVVSKTKGASVKPVTNRPGKSWR